MAVEARFLDNHATFNQATTADAAHDLWNVTVYDAPAYKSFTIFGLPDEATANKVASDLKARGYHDATVAQDASA